MKRTTFIILSMLALACTPIPNGGGGTAPKIKAKVVRITCASTVIQILDPNYYSLGEIWPVYGTTDTVEHAVKVLNKCEFPDNLSAGAEFYFKKITASEARNDCAVCMLWDAPPDAGIYVRVVN